MALLSLRAAVRITRRSLQSGKGKGDGSVTWRKSTYSFSNGACVEIGAWRKSTKSASSECVEAGNGNRTIAVRDTMEASHSYRTTLEFTTSAWQRFITQLRLQ